MTPTQEQIDAFHAAGGGEPGLNAAMALLPAALIDAVHSTMLVRLTQGLQINVVDGNAQLEWPTPSAVKAQVLADIA